MALATRIRTSGGAFFPPTNQVFDLLAAPDGAWTFFGGPRALYSAGNTYIGYVEAGSGNVCLRVYHHASATLGPEIVCKAALDVDDHVNPSLLIRPDGKLAAFYSRHSPLSTTMHMRVSTSTLASDPDLSDGFASEVSLDAQLGAGSYDYPQPIYLSDEGLIYLFWRDIPSGNNYNLMYSTSAEGDTWTAGTLLYHNSTKTTRAYWQIASNGVDRIDFAVTDGSPNTDTTHLAHFYYDGSWRKTDGTSIGSPDFDFADLTPVYTSANTWVLDIALVAGSPRILHPTFPTEFSDHRYREARWTGAAWISPEITPAGNGIDTATHVYSGGIAYDQADPSRVYASREVSSEWEMYLFTRSGETWTGTALTAGSSAKNIRPVVPKDHGPGLDAYWMHGTYTAYEDAGFNTGIRAVR